MLSLGETGQRVHGICILFLTTACEYTQLFQNKNSIKIKSWDCMRSPRDTVEREKGQGPPTELWGI